MHLPTKWILLLLLCTLHTFCSGRNGQVFLISSTLRINVENEIHNIYNVHSVNWSTFVLNKNIYEYIRDGMNLMAEIQSNV